MSSLGWATQILFQSLEILTFDDMLDWEEWSHFVVDGAQTFAHLSELFISKCLQLLQKLPSKFFRLRKLKIEECPLVKVSRPIEINEVRIRLTLIRSSYYLLTRF